MTEAEIRADYKQYKELCRGWPQREWTDEEREAICSFEMAAPKMVGVLLERIDELIEGEVERNCLIAKQARQITRLEAEIARLKAELKPLQDAETRRATLYKIMNYPGVSW